MNKLLCVMLSAIVIMLAISPEQAADAQVPYTLRCCDGNAVVRCQLVNWTPVGNPCFCYGQGWGYAC